MKIRYALAMQHVMLLALVLQPTNVLVMKATLEMDQNVQVKFGLAMLISMLISDNTNITLQL